MIFPALLFVFFVAQGVAGIFLRHGPNIVQGFGCAAGVGYWIWSEAVDRRLRRYQRERLSTAEAYIAHFRHAQQLANEEFERKRGNPPLGNAD